MNIEVRHAPKPLAILSANLDDLLALADAEAAESLNAWMAALKCVEAVYEVSYGQRLVIIRHFEERSLWQYLIDPDTDQTFPSMTAWLSSGFIGCRRVNFEALRTGKALADVPAAKVARHPQEQPAYPVATLHGSTWRRCCAGSRSHAEAGGVRGETGAPTIRCSMSSAGRQCTSRPGRSDRRVIDRWIE